MVSERRGADTEQARERFLLLLTTVLFLLLVAGSVAILATR